MIHSRSTIRFHPRLVAGLASLLASAIVLGPISAPAQVSPSSAESRPAGPGPLAAAAARAADAFIATLDDRQRARVQFAFDDEAQRKNWSNLPTGIYQRKGLRLGELTPAQRAAALALLAATLSKSGYEKVWGIMEGDQVLPKPAGNIIFGRDEYYLSFLGKPSATEPWSIQFGGHHLALNLTLAGRRGTLAPSHTAAQPARFELQGKTIRPLGRENDLAFELINNLGAAERQHAILGAKFRDLVLGPGHDGRMIAPEGVSASTFNAHQKQLLLDLIREWVGIVGDDAAAPKMAEVQAGLNETRFAWSGPTTQGSAAYFRIQGPAVFIEYAPQTLGGDPTQHIHTIYRDPTNEYGKRDRKP